MKVIFSRKGFDDAYGGSPSPIMPDGRLLSLPIPTKKKEVGFPYSELHHKHRSYAQIIKELGIKLSSKDCHLDPDLVLHRTKPKAWKSAFGQQGAAAKHLMNQGVEVGDLFLFFGSFKRTYTNSKSRLQFENDFPRHIIFGYLLVGEIIDLSKESNDVKEKYSWHPHIQNDYGNNNLLFVAAKKSKHLQNSFGTFKYDEKLVLTRQGYRKSIWDLPRYFHPDNGTKISRHQTKTRYQLRGDRLVLQTVGIGQDFIVHSQDARVEKWAINLVNELG